MNATEILNYVITLEAKVKRYERALDVYYRMGNWEGNKFLIENEGWHLANEALFPFNSPLRTERKRGSETTTQRKEK